MPQMALEDIQAASERQLARERRVANRIPESTPAFLTPAIEAFAHSLGESAPVFISVLPDRYGLYGWCSDGVQEKVKHDGGGCLFGWTIWEWPGVMVTAEFHAVWKSNTGELIDITPKPKEEARILFVPDRGYPDDFNFDLRPRNRRQRLHLSADREMLAKSLSAKLAGGKRRYEEQRARKANLSLEAWLLSKVPADPLTEKIDLLIATCNAFDEHFDTLGTAGLVAVDDEFERLMNRRLMLQQQVKQLAKRPI